MSLCTGGVRAGSSAGEHAGDEMDRATSCSAAPLAVPPVALLSCAEGAFTEALCRLVRGGSVAQLRAELAHWQPWHGHVPGSLFVSCGLANRGIPDWREKLRALAAARALRPQPGRAFLSVIIRQPGVTAEEVADLVACGADVAEESGAGCTVLHLAATLQAHGAMEGLLRAGADPDAIGCAAYAAMDAELSAAPAHLRGPGCTPLHLSAARFDAVGAELLTRHGASPHARDAAGYAPRHIARGVASTLAGRRVGTLFGGYLPHNAGAAASTWQDVASPDLLPAAETATLELVRACWEWEAAARRGAVAHAALQRRRDRTTAVGDSGHSDADVKMAAVEVTAVVDEAVGGAAADGWREKRAAASPASRSSPLHHPDALPW
jgi:hypothetical protein